MWAIGPLCANQMNTSKLSQEQAGVTLIEMLVALAIAAILASMAVPSFSRFINDTRQSSTVTQLMSDLNRARSEAVKRGQRVLVCARASDTACAMNLNWQNGWLVCYDENKDDQCDLGSVNNPNPIVVRRAIHTNLTLTSSAAVIRFKPNGTQGSGGEAKLTLTGNWDGAQPRYVIIKPTGYVSGQ